MITGRVRRATESSDEARSQPAADALSIGRRIRHFRTEAGLTLSELGERIDRAAHRLAMLVTESTPRGTDPFEEPTSFADMMSGLGQ